MSLRIIQSDPAGQDKEVVLEIDPVGSGASGVQTYQVNGKVVDYRGAGVSNITIRSYHKGLTSAGLALLGEAISNASGDYLIYYTTDLLPTGKQFADLVVKAFDTSTDDLLYQSPIITNALPVQEVILSISSNETFVGLSEYTRIKTALEPLLTGLQIDQLTLDDIGILANESGFQPLTVGDYISALTLNANTTPVNYSVISDEIYYGLFRYNLPYDPVALIESPSSLLREGIEAATSSNIIDPGLMNSIQSILDAFSALRASSLLIDPVSVSGDSYIAQILDIAGIPVSGTPPGERENFTGAYTDYGSEEDFWTLVEQAAVFVDDSGTGGFSKAQKRDNVKAAFQIGVVSQEYPPLVSLVFNDVKNGTSGIVENIELVGEITPAQWKNYITASGGNAGAPNIDPADITILDEEKYVDALMTASEKAFPTEVLRTYMSTDGSYASSDVYNFLVANTAFDIKDSSPRTYFSDNNITDQVLKDNIYKLKRLWHLSDGYNKLLTIKLLESLSLLSATQISNIGKRTFLKRFSADFGGTAEALKIFKVAIKRSSAAAKLQASHNPAVNSVSTSVFTDSSIAQADVSGNPSLEVMFGSQDYCACRHCRSSFSPAAYLIDLLTFLKQTQVYDDSGNLTSSNAWDIFKIRRPEFEKIELSCDNTNVTLPYIDLVNEVLENQILKLNSQPESLLRQTTLETDALRGRPEHLSKEAYDYLIASAAVYPWILPFHLWNEEVAAYLKLVDLNRYDLTNAFSSSIQLDSASSKVAVGMSSALYTVLGDNTSFTEYYDDKITSTLQNVGSLLDVTGLTFDELESLLDTEYINPNNDAINFATESCDLATATLVFTTTSDRGYKHLHKFVRLQRLLGWSVAELDQVLMSFGADNVSDALVVNIAGVQILSQKLRRSVADVIIFYSDLSETTYGTQLSQYDQIFLNPRYNTSEVTRTLFANGTGIALVQGGQLDGQNSPVVAAALGMKGSELLLLIENELTSGSNVDKTDLAHLYRVSVLARSLKLTIQDYLDYKSIINTTSDPISAPGSVVDPNDTLEWIELLEVVENSTFKLNDLRVLFKHEKLSSKKLDDKSLDLFLGTIRNKIQGRLSEKGISSNRSREDLLNLFLIFLNEENAIRAIEIVDKVQAGTISEANTFIDTYWTGLVQNKSLVKSSLTASGGSITTEQDRRDFVFDQFNQSLVNALLIDDVLSQSISDHLGYSRESVTTLVFAELAINSYFTNTGFSYSTGDVNTLADYQQMKESLIKLSKTLLVLDGLGVEQRHISMLMNDSATTGWFDLNALPVQPVSSVANFDGFIRLIQAFQLEATYLKPDEFSIIDHLQAGIADYPALSEGTGWDLNDITYLSGSGMAYATNSSWLVNMARVIHLLSKLGMSAEQAHQYVGVDLTYEESQAIQAGIKANFSDDTWQKIGVEVRDDLRIKQRDALATYLIANSTSPDPEFDGLNSLYEYFLMDVEMAPCMQTSRIKLALSSIQLWVQRIRMDLEPGIKFGQEELDEWEWRKNYRVWEAARKVFLYPENWLEPELRDDKSPFFKDMEDELLQDEVTMESAEKAYLNYLTKLDDVAVLEISGIYREEDLSILHVYARTKNSPHIYYYRRQEDGFRWTAWEKIELDIEGEHLIPMVFNRRPMIFWPVFSEVPKKIEDDSISVSTSASKVSIKNPVTYAEVKMAYSEWKNNKWQPKKISKTKIYSTKSFIPANYFFKIDTSTGELRIDTFYHEEKSTAYAHLGGFLLNNCSADIEVDVNKSVPAPSTFSVKNAYRSYMKIKEEAGNESLVITERINFKRLLVLNSDQILSAFERVLLKKTPGRFKITYPVTGVDLLSEVPFFFEDKNRVFFVQPTEEVFEREVLLKLPLGIIRLRRDLRVAAQTEEVLNDDSKVIKTDGDDDSNTPTGGGGGGNGGGGEEIIGNVDGELLKENLRKFQFIQ